MVLRELSIVNYKNIPEAELEFSPKINGFLGRNGMGKSNLLDAVYYLSFCKSFNGVTDSMVISRGESFAMLRGVYERRGAKEEITAGLTAGKRKSFKRKGKEYQRLSEHIGSFPLVIVSPRDSDLITGASDERRRLMDQVISQSDTLYLDHLIRYGRALEQRNKLLREHIVDHTLYEAVELAMTISAGYITDARFIWAERLQSIFEEYYKLIAGDGEPVALTYERPRLPLDSLLDQARRHDEIAGHTSVGPHRDDLSMEIASMPARRVASQGQCKTFTVALRLAQYEFLRQHSGLKPLLLLDDIFDKLDSTRVERIMEIARRDSIGQIFVTDTNRDHLDEIMSRMGGDYRLWEVERGRFSPIHTTTPTE